jgi:hypothetical protein
MSKPSISLQGISLKPSESGASGRASPSLAEAPPEPALGPAPAPPPAAVQTSLTTTTIQASAVIEVVPDEPMPIEESRVPVTTRIRTSTNERLRALVYRSRKDKQHHIEAALDLYLTSKGL